MELAGAIKDHKALVEFSIGREHMLSVEHNYVGDDGARALVGAAIGNPVIKLLAVCKRG